MRRLGYALDAKEEHIGLLPKQTTGQADESVNKEPQQVGAVDSPNDPTDKSQYSEDVDEKVGKCCLIRQTSQSGIQEGTTARAVSGDCRS